MLQANSSPRSVLRHAACAAIVLLATGARRDVAADEAALVHGFDIESFDVASFAQAAESGEPFELDYFGDSHLIQLERAELRSDRFKVQRVDAVGARTLYPARTRTYKGFVVGDAFSSVRLTIDDRGIRGYIRDESGWTFLDPLSLTVAKNHGAATERALSDPAVAHRVYAEVDLATHDVGRCQERSETNGAELLPQAEPLAEDTPEENDDGPVPGGALGTMEIAVVADFEYFQRFGANTLNEIETVLNTVEGIYEDDIGLAIEIVDVTIWETELDPYESTDPDGLLLELRNHWNGNKRGVHRDLVHLFTGKNLDGSTIGIAYVSQVCRLNFAYALSQDLGSMYLDMLLVAHETGHGMGAAHDPTGTNPRYVMYPSLGGSNLDEFSPVSQTAMTRYANNVTCLGGTSDGIDGVEGGGGGGRRSRGGGGGPVDPWTLALLAGGFAAQSWRRRRQRAA